MNQRGVGRCREQLAAGGWEIIKDPGIVTRPSDRLCDFLTEGGSLPVSMVIHQTGARSRFKFEKSDLMTAQVDSDR